MYGCIILLLVIFNLSAMRVSLSALVWTLVVLGGASLIGRVVHVLSVDVTEFSPEHHEDENTLSKSSDEMHVNSKPHHLVWFVQVLPTYFEFDLCLWCIY